MNIIVDTFLGPSINRLFFRFLFPPAIYSLIIPRGKNSAASKAKKKLERSLFRQARFHRQHIIEREVGFNETAAETSRRIVEQRRQAALLNSEMNRI